ncbi:hypothetical protein KC337_g5 [Hortaea werneckii]|nr:hypothetical protein KC337_g5 [Hortaea werneckii]
MAAESSSPSEEGSKTVQDIQTPSSNIEKPNTSEPPSDQASHVDGDRPHLRVIPRPPEWDNPRHETADESEGADSETSEAEGDSSHSDHEGEDQRLRDQDVSGTPAEKGILLSFPNLELHGIKLLEVSSLSITIKCERCKDTMDVHRLRNYSVRDYHGVAGSWYSRRERRLGHGDLQRMPQENDPTHLRAEIPSRQCDCGEGKQSPWSFRWFRFSCCSKVFPCDRCHDQQSDHPLEHANPTIWALFRPHGYCSREQNYRPEDCGICHALMIGKKGSGFWEGGKGTRDPKRMSRKDPRKYKRRPGTKPKT